MARAVWKDRVIATCDESQVIVVEGNLYFPASALDRACVEESDTTTVCGWKGTASYYDVVVDGERNRDAAWYYPEPKEAAAQIKDHVAFWNGVEVER